MVREHICQTKPEDHIQSQPSSSPFRLPNEARRLRWLGKPARHAVFVILVVLAFSGVLLSSVFADPVRAATVYTIAGDALKSVDGTGSAARFYNPNGICFDPANGNLYVVDTGNHTIRQVTPAGVVTTFAGSPGRSGSADGTGGAARFYYPEGICYDSADGNLYVTDRGNSTIRRVTPGGVVTTLAGSPGTTGNADGTGSAALFREPYGICYDSANGNLYVTEYGNRAIRQVTPAGVVTTIADTPGTYVTAPYGICYDSADGNLYVADGWTSTICRVTPAGVVTTIAGYPEWNGSTDGTGSAARFSGPDGICFNPADGNLYVADTYNGAIRQVTPAGVVTTLAGSPDHQGPTDGTGSAAVFGNPSGICFDSTNGDLYVTDGYFDGADSTIRQVTPAGVVTTLAGSPGNYRGSTDGTGSAARFYYPAGIAYDSANGNLYVADNNAIHQVTPAGVVTTLAGSWGPPGSADGTGSAARFYNPEGICYNSDNGNLYVTDSEYGLIRQVTPAGVVTTIAGSPGYYYDGNLDGTGSAARFHYPRGICYNSADGNLYVVDSGTIRQVTPAGVVTTIAGNSRQSGIVDGTGSAARFDCPADICYNSADGNLYVTEVLACTVRRVTPAGVVTTIAGSPGDYYNSIDGTGSAARFQDPEGICYNSADGNLYVVDSGNCTIRQVTPSAVVTTIAGSPGQSGNADGTGSAARFYSPSGICFDSANGNLYVADSGNCTIRLVTLISPFFSDIASSPYQTAILDIASRGVIKGFPDETFRPDSPVIRQQFAKMIVKTLGLIVTGNEFCPFADVDSGMDLSDPFYPDKYVAVCALNGITQGKTPTTFAPYANMTRAQLLTMVVRAATQLGILDDPSPAYYQGTTTGSHFFRTWDDPDHALNAQTAEFNGLLEGIVLDDSSSLSWDPYKNATRGEVAQILWRLWQKMGSSSEGREITIGFVTPLTGSLAIYGVADQYCLERWREAVGEGLVLGDGKKHQVTFIVRDSQSDSNRAAQVAGDLINNAKVDMMMVASTPETVLPVADQCEALGVPCISADALWQNFFFGRGGDPAVGFKWTYHYSWGLEDIINTYTAMCDQVQTNKKAGMLFQNDADYQGWMDPSAAPKAFAEKGYILVVPQPYSVPAEDFTQQISIFKQEGVDIINGVMSPSDFVNFWRQSWQQGFKPKIATVSKALRFPQTLEAIGDIGVGLTTEVSWSPAFPFQSSLTGETCQQLAADFEARTGQQWMQALMHYAVGEMAIDALERAQGLISKQSILEALKTTKLDTIAGPLDFTSPVAEGTLHPVPNVYKSPLAGGQWVKGARRPYDLTIVDNTVAPMVAVQSEIQPLP